MKFELTKETSFNGTFYWVKVDNSSSGQSQCFSESREQEAIDYMEKLIAHYAKYGSLDSACEVIISKEVTPPTI